MPPQPITLNVLSDDEDFRHFTIAFSRPGRVEVVVVNGNLVAHVYDGDQDNEEQEPLFAYDSGLARNRNVTN